MKLYVNGQLISTAYTNGRLPNFGSNTKLIIGARATITQFYHGIVDDVSIYSRAISAEEVMALYNNFTCQPKIAAPTVKGASRCSNGVLTLSASGSTQYHWYESLTQTIPLAVGNKFTTPILNTSKTYYVTSVQNGFESERVPVTATILPLPSEPIVADVSRCGPGNVTLQATGGIQYRWYTGLNTSTSINTQPNYSLSITATTTFYVSSFNGDCESSRRPVTVVVHPLPILDCRLPNEAKTKKDTLFVVSVTSGTPPYQYQWEFGNGTLISGENNAVIYSYPRSGNYTISVKVTDASGCEAVCSQDIRVYASVNAPPNVFTPNGDPHNETFTINYTGDEEFEMVIYNRWGKWVATSTDGVKGWDGTGCTTGIYFYQIKVANQELKGWVSLLR